MRYISSTTDDGICGRQFVLGDIPGTLWTPAGGGDGPLILIGHGGRQHKAASAVVAGAHRFVTGLGATVAAIDAPGHGDRPPITPPWHGRRPSLPEVVAFNSALAALAAPDWQAVIDALTDGPVGYWGTSLGAGIGIPLVAAEPRIGAAVLGLAAGPLDAAAEVMVPVEFLLQWHDELVPREQALALFDALGSAAKTLHANPGGHGEVPAFEHDSSVRFFARHLGDPRV